MGNFFIIIKFVAVWKIYCVFFLVLISVKIEHNFNYINIQINIIIRIKKYVIPFKNTNKTPKNTQISTFYEQWKFTN